MKRTKLTVRLPEDVLNDAREYARRHGTTLTRLVVTHLESLPEADDFLAEAPITRRLAGSLDPTADAEEYGAYLQEKYGR